MLNVRTKSVTFRITEEEFAWLRSATLLSGARSLSDFARTAMLRLASSRRSQKGADATKHSRGVRLLSVEQRMEKIEITLEELAGALADLTGSAVQRRTRDPVSPIAMPVNQPRARKLAESRPPNEMP